jgi:cell division protein FtsB
LFSNAKNLEKYAREKYLMKRDDEDVFIIIKK